MCVCTEYVCTSGDACRQPEKRGRPPIVRSALRPRFMCPSRRVLHGSLVFTAVVDDWCMLPILSNPGWFGIRVFFSFPQAFSLAMRQDFPVSPWTLAALTRAYRVASYYLFIYSMWNTEYFGLVVRTCSDIYLLILRVTLISFHSYSLTKCEMKAVLFGLGLVWLFLLHTRWSRARSNPQNTP